MSNTTELFDGWAASYNSFIETRQDKFPFAGYDALNDQVLEMIPADAVSVLDIGIGTGTLAKRIKDKTSAAIYGMDLSHKMLQQCGKVMSDVTLLQQDFGADISLPAEWPAFDCIISNYTFHHFDDRGKLERIIFLMNKLKPCGKLIIGDIAFWDQTALTIAKERYQKLWDDEEYYFAIRETVDQLHKLNVGISLYKVSFCAWILVLVKH